LPFGKLFGNVVYFVVIWYITSCFLVCCTNKNLATLFENIFFAAAANFRIVCLTPQLNVIVKLYIFSVSMNDNFFCKGNNNIFLRSMHFLLAPRKYSESFFCVCECVMKRQPDTAKPLLFSRKWRLQIKLADERLKRTNCFVSTAGRDPPFCNSIQ
jgi:hypothetical protein